MTLQEENEKLRELLLEFCERVERGEVRSKSTYAKFRDALSQQTEPMEPAPEQDERDSVIAHIELCITNLKAEHQTNPRVIAEVLYNIGYSRATRPVQTEQQPIRLPARKPGFPSSDATGEDWENSIAQTAPQPEQSGLVEALAAAAQSLEAISNRAGKDEFMQDMAAVRSYARSRAGVARAALSVQEK